MSLEARVQRFIASLVVAGGTGIACGEGTTFSRVVDESPVEQTVPNRDDGLIAFMMKSAGENGDLYVISTQGGNLFRVTDTPDWEEYPEQWLPDGRRIYFGADFNDNPGGFPSSLRSRDKIIYFDTGELYDIPRGGRGVMWPRLSSDGTKIAALGFNEDSAIYIKNIENGTVTRVPLPQGQSAYLAWSPDSRSLACVVFAWEDEESGVYVTNGARTTFSPFPGDVRVVGWRSPTDVVIQLPGDWEYEGERYSVPDRLYNLDSATSAVSPITPENENGWYSSIAFTTEGKMYGLESHGIYQLSPNGGSRQLMVHPNQLSLEAFSSFAVSPDGTYFVIEGIPERGRSNLYTVLINEGLYHQLTDIPSGRTTDPILWMPGERTSHELQR